MTYSEITASLNSLTSAELSKLNVELIDAIKSRRKTEANSVKATIKLYTVVRVNHPKAYGKTFTVNQINRTKAVLVDNNSNARISAPLSLIESVY